MRVNPGCQHVRTDLIDMIRDRLQSIFDAEAIYRIPPQMPQIVPCAFRNDANLIGAWHQNVTVYPHA
ncbi:MAG: hypothetical protein IJI12_09585 [Atopobiaceae bacterium]|nr:hypothetical protein [Atopobiaceae bacterium]